MSFAYKHFGGRPDLRVRQGGAQWTADAQNVQTFMTAVIRRIEPALRAHDNANATEYYYTGDAGRNIGKSKGSLTSVYTIQITYNRTANTISYHGYPDEPARTKASDTLATTSSGRSRSRWRLDRGCSSHSWPAALESVLGHVRGGPAASTTASHAGDAEC